MNMKNDPISAAEREAKIFMDFAMELYQASVSSNAHQKLVALEHNLKLWVEIESSLKNAKSLLSPAIKENLLKLSKYIERLILSRGVENMRASDYNTMININMQISEGLLESIKNTLAQEEAFSLLRCAIDLSSAREKSDSKDLIAALDNNLKLWVYIKTLASSKKSKLPQETKSNLIKLADYVSKKTMEVGQNIDAVNSKTLDSMIMTNLQISEGLMAPTLQKAC